MSEMTDIPPRWAFERMEAERCKFFCVEPNPLNVDVFMRDPLGWAPYHAFASYIARAEQMLREVTEHLASVTGADERPGSDSADIVNRVREMIGEKS